MFHIRSIPFLITIMRFLRLDIDLYSYFYSGRSPGLVTLWTCICIVLLFPLQADSYSLAFPDENLFLNEPYSDSNSNFFLDDDSGSRDFTSLSIEPQPILDDIDLTSGLTDQLLLADGSDDQCSTKYILPSSSSKSRLRARLTSDRCNNPNVVVEGAEAGKNPTLSAEEIKKLWCAGTKVPIPEFGNVPVCQEVESGVFSEYLLPEPEPSSGVFETLFKGIMSKIFDLLI